MRRRVLSPIFVAALGVACLSLVAHDSARAREHSTGAAHPADFAFEYASSSGERIDTFHGKVTKDRISDPDITIRFRFTAAQLDTIWQAMSDEHLLEQPDPPASADCLQQPNWTHVLRVRAEGRERVFRWDSSWGCSDSVRNSRSWRALHAVVPRIMAIVKAAPAYRKLPPSRGGYI